MRRLIGPAILTSLALALVAPPLSGGAISASLLAARPPLTSDGHAVAAPVRPQRFTLPAQVGLKVAVGYHEQYRPAAWVPVRVSLHNNTAGSLTGLVTIPDDGGGSQYSRPSYGSTYSESVVLPPGGTKRVTLYLPGRDVGDQVNVEFRVGSRIIARVSDTPTSAAESTITIGTLSNDPQIAAWVRQARSPAGSLDVIGLTPPELDSVPEVLATFDAIVLTNVDSTRLTPDQTAALARYVQLGGSLLVVGGPDWQETLRPIASTLVPGTLTGSQTVQDLSGLQALGMAGIPRKPTIVSRLVHPQGLVVAQQSGIPLIVRRHVGSGRIMYVGFDPAVDPLASWAGARELSTTLVQQLTPQVLNRLSVNGFQGGIFRGRFGASIIRQELANVPDAMQPMLWLLVLLILVSIAILGPVNFLVFRRLRRSELAWIAMPALGIVLLVATVTSTVRFKDRLVLLNTVSVVQMDGTSQRYPASLYVGLFSSLRGAYHMVWNGRALPQGLPQYSFNGASGPNNTAPGVALSEGAQTAVDFPSMNMWSTRSVALRTTVNIAGSLHGKVHVAPDGTLVGTVWNDTDLTLLDPAILAGSAVLRLADLPPHSTRSVRIRPSVDMHDHTRTMVWDRIYGKSQASGDLGSWDGDPWEEPPPGTETSFTDRLRNVGDRLPGAQSIPVSSEVMLLGWNESALGSLTVNGVTPRRRDLNLIETPLSVNFAPGTFRFRQGTLGAYLVDGRPLTAQNGCCAFSSGSRVVGVGAGGFAVFQFDLPHASHMRVQQLTVSINAGGADGTKIAQVYDWRSGHWVHLNLQPIDGVLTRPARFVSTDGTVQVRLHSTFSSGDIMIADPLQDVQLSGTVTVE